MNPDQNPSTTPHTTPPAPIQGSKGMAVAALVLSIIGLVLTLLIFISIPLAITAAILSIIVLAKHKPGKGFAIASLVMAGATLAIAPLLFLITLTSYNGITDRAYTSAGKANATSALKKAELYLAEEKTYPANSGLLTTASQQEIYYTSKVPFTTSSTEPTGKPDVVGSVKFFSCGNSGVQVEYWDYDMSRWTALTAGDCQSPTYVPAQ